MVITLIEAQPDTCSPCPLMSTTWCGRCYCHSTAVMRKLRLGEGTHPPRDPPAKLNGKSVGLADTRASLSLGLPEQTLSQRGWSRGRLSVSFWGLTALAPAVYHQWPRNLYCGFHYFPSLQACSINYHFYEFQSARWRAELHLALTAVERTKTGGGWRKDRGFPASCMPGTGQRREKPPGLEDASLGCSHSTSWHGEPGPPSAFVIHMGGVSPPLQIL